ncbi:MAG: 5-methylcytosine-specific restriction endonuclease system specificity protein McrC [Bacilli bacterium]|nr:5-methylcytosine-specific restriction endonuclease system specificity protein McrC [Bacilli bacterium]
MILVKNIYYMLSYAFRILNEGAYEDVRTEEFDNIYDLLSSIILKALSLLLKRGVGRQYVSLKEESSSIRGKIDVTASIKSNLINKQKLICEYDDFSVNTYMNKIIKTTICLLIKQDIDSQKKKELTNILRYFNDVETLDYNHINWNFTYNKSNKHYELLMSLCYLVLKGMLQTEEDGTIRLKKFIDDQKMCRLYEKFILEFYKKECQWLKVSSSKIDWQLDDDVNDYLPNMQSDIMLENNNNILIIDAKYYGHNTQNRFDSKKIISNNLYQIFTYVKNKQLSDTTKKVSGMLLYAKTTDEFQPIVDYIMSGNKISIKVLDLNTNFDEIKRLLFKIIEDLTNT